MLVEYDQNVNRKLQTGMSTSIKPHKLHGNNLNIKILISSKSISCAQSKGQIHHTLTLQSTSASSQKEAISDFPKKYTQSTPI